MSKISLQLALDVGERDHLLAVAEKTRQYVDWIEAGTPWIMKEGMAVVSLLRSRYPEKQILADLKIVDGGYHEARLGFEAGAGLVTVLGLAGEATILEALKAAREFKGKIVVDFLQVSDVVQPALHMIKLGIDYLCLHTAFDDQASGKSPLAELELLGAKIALPIIVAGGISLENLAQVTHYRPAAVVVGSALTCAEDPAEAARKMRGILDGSD